uniref:Betaine--homocysteine S-methyltransferase 1-like n=1 Tax=Salarias fasciatus TaxID=181472 RepID=A0A672HVN3_SALFA
LGQNKKGMKGILERLDAGEVVVGDGGYVLQLERRGYVKAGHWTPEAAVEHPEAVRQLEREFLRAGADVIQTFTFYCSEDKLELSGNVSNITGAQINNAACDLAREVADEGGALVAGGVSQTPLYVKKGSENEVKAIFKKQLDDFLKKDIDFFMVEVRSSLKTASFNTDTLNMSGRQCGPIYCAAFHVFMKLYLHPVGADIVGINCHLDPLTCVRTVKLMKEGLEKAGLKAHLMVQPLGFHTPECNIGGYVSLPEYPFALETRIITRWDVHKYAREAYNAGIRYIGGCCGFEPYHIRAISEELAEERGFLPPASTKHSLWASTLETHTKPWVKARAGRQYWENLLPASGRPKCPSMATPTDGRP